MPVGYLLESHVLMACFSHLTLLQSHRVWIAFRESGSTTIPFLGSRAGAQKQVGEEEPVAW